MSEHTPIEREALRKAVIVFYPALLDANEDVIDAELTCMKVAIDTYLGAVRDQGQPEPDDDDAPCSHCGGEADCMAGADPLGRCPEDPHRCHACGGSGRAKDQVIF